MAGIQRRGGIERKILRQILWVGIIPISVALIVGYIITHEGQRNAVERTLSTAAQKTASGLLLALNSRLRTIKTLSRDPEIIEALTPGALVTPQTLDSLQERLSIEGRNADDGVSVYSLFDSSGRLVMSTGELSPFDQVHESWLEQVTEADFIDFKNSADGTQYYARCVAPVFSPKTNERIGFLCEDQGTAKLLHFALGEGSGQRDEGSGIDVYQVAYVRVTGAVMMSFLDPDAPLRLKFEMANMTSSKLAAVLSRADAKDAGAMRVRDYKTDGLEQDVLLAYYRLLGQPGVYTVYIVVYRPATAVFSAINLWALYSILGSMLVIGLFLLLAYRNVHNNIVRPVLLLNEGAQIIRQGDLELKLKIVTGDEIEELASSFNKMALALGHNIGQLEESEEKHRSLVTSMRDGIYQTDPEGLISFVNPAGSDIFGYASPEEAVGHNIRDLFLEEIDYARMSNELEKQSFVERTRIWMKRRDGRAICVEVSGNLVLDDEGGPIGAEGIFRDVTSAVRLEQQARERSERIAAINQIANVINSSLEAGRLHESLIVELKKLVNFDYADVALLHEKGDVFERRPLWPDLRVAGAPGGHRREDDEVQLGSAAAAWVARERKSLVVDDLRQSQAEFVEEFPAETRSCLCVPLYATGRIIGTLNLGADSPAAFSKHDIDVLEEMSPHIAVAMRNARLLENLQQSLEEVTRAREKLHDANEELKTLDEMKTNLLSNVSHELRTPLVAVMGYTDMIYHRKVGPINEVQSEYLGIILRNIEKLVTLIENLLDFSRLHRGTEKLVFDTFDLVDCARGSIQNVQPIADSRKVAIACEASDERVLVEGDKGKMGQVFNNLLSNAVKFNKTDGSVVVRIQRREDSVEVTVTDTGIGIPAEALDKVFTRFYQYDSSSTRKYGGTGIGLSIAQDIVRLHGSRITVTSDVGKGSVFRFALPIRVTPADKPESGAEPFAPVETHLLIELVTQDRGLNLQVRDLLLAEGMEVVHALHPKSAVELVHRYRPDCILVDVESDEDVGAPEDGRTVIDDLLADEKASGLPIVLLTNDDALFEQYRFRVAGRIRHGFRKSGLLSSIHYALGQRVPNGEQLGQKVLCVDDDPEILVFITRCLENEGYVADGCASGQDALTLVATREYGLVLLDIAMPGLDGWEVSRRIKSDASLAGIKVYLVTAKPIDRATPRIQDVGADGFLPKPFKPEDLLELVHASLPIPSVEQT